MMNEPDITQTRYAQHVTPGVEQKKKAVAGILIHVNIMHIILNGSKVSRYKSESELMLCIGNSPGYIFFT